MFSVDRQELISQIRDIAAGYLKERNLELVDLICRWQGRDLVLRIIADRPEGGISLGECAYLNKALGAILDEKNILQERYILEISSPGIDRPLKAKNDFLRCLNKKAHFFLNAPLKGKTEWEGVISQLSDDAISIEREGEILEIPLAQINQAKQII